MSLSVCDTLSECQADTALIQSLYEGLPEDGASLLLLTRDGQIRAGYPEDGSSLQQLSNDAWQDIVRRIDDGDDPVITGTNDACLVITELPRALGPWAYATVVLPQRSVEHVLQNFDLIQMILGQMALFCRGS
jgi:hypothetical protein